MVGFGTSGRVALSAVRTARAQGIKVGIFRPISLNPFPYEQIEELAEKAKCIPCCGDEQRADAGRCPHGCTDGPS